MRAAVRRLRAGECVVIFPEGGVRVGEYSAVRGNGEFKEGAAAIALLARVPVVPVVLTGTRALHDGRNWFFRRPPIGIEFGEPILLDRRASRQEASDHLLHRMQQLAHPLPRVPA